MNRITAAAVGFPFLFMLIAVSSLGASGKAAVSIFLFGITAAVFAFARLKGLKISAIIGGMLAAALACAMFAAVQFDEQRGYIEGVEYNAHLVGTVVSEPEYDGHYKYIIKTDDGKRLLFYADELSNGELYSRFEGDVIMYLRHSVNDGTQFSAYSDNEQSCRFTDGQSGALSIFSSIRSWSAKRIDEVSSGEAAQFLKGVMLGEESELGANLQKAFRATGLSHILVISGSHLTTVLLAITVCFTVSRRSRRSYYLSALALMLAYMALVGFGPSVVRSGICCVIVGLGFVLIRDSSPVNSLGAAALITGIIDPYTAVSVGFQLSFFSTLGIVTVGLLAVRKIRCLKIPKLIKVFLNMFIVTVSAQLFILPVLLPIYSELSVMSVLANLLTGFAVDIAVICALIYLVLCASCILYPIAIPFGYVAACLTRYCIFIAYRLSAQGLAYISIPKAVWVTLAAVLLCTAAAVLIIKSKRCVLVAAAVLSLSLALSIAATVSYNNAIHITCASNGVYIITYKGDSVAVLNRVSRYNFNQLIYSNSRLTDSNIRLLVSQDSTPDLFITAMSELNPDAVMAPYVQRLARLYGDKVALFDSGSVTPFDNCRVTDSEQCVLVSICGVNIALSKEYGSIPSEYGVDVLLCVNKVSAVADTAVILFDAKPLALKANKVYNTLDDSFSVAVSKNGSIISAE